VKKTIIMTTAAITLSACGTVPLVDGRPSPELLWHLGQGGAT
jgi:hypothetical protein